MTPTRWQQVQDLFYAAEEIEPSARAVFLAAECAGDSELQLEVEKLLEAATADADPIAEPLRAVAGDLAATREPGPGDRIGPYEIVRTLGAGGMGAVYLARRTGGDFRQQVAIKVIRFGLDQREIHLRFRAERQILANLVHPNIARLLDGGVTPSGQPYLVMEYVDGAPLLDHCRTLALEQKLELFRQICNGVQCAHQNLVVHRDLKPANILVSKDGTPKLLDFGIAKLLDPTVTGETVAVTTHTERLMTPEYASPEQVRGEPITTATDVYSLGVLLYELLTGQRPFQFKSRTPLELERVICETEPARPSTVHRAVDSEPGAQAPLLGSDLDNIVLKAMQKDPARRYGSAFEFAEDLRRYLEGYPVQARRDSWRYRGWKFVRRNRWPVALAATVAVLIIGFGIGMGLLARKARLEAARAEQVSEFLVGLFQEAEPERAQGRTVTALEVLDKGVERVKGLDHQPQLQAELFKTFGLAYEQLGAYGKSRRLLERGLELRRKLNGPGTAEEADMLKNAAELARRERNLDTAESMARESIAIRKRVLGERHHLTADSINTLALVKQAKGDLKEAESLFLEVLAMRDILGPREHLETALLSNLGGLFFEMGEYDKAAKYLRECIDIRRKTLGPLHPRLAIPLAKLANVLRTQGDFAGAGAAEREALAVRQKSLGPNHPEVAQSHAGLAEILREQGQFDEAERQLLEARSILAKSGAKSPANDPELHLALLYEDRGDLARAEAVLRERLLGAPADYGESSLPLARLRLALGRVLLARAPSGEAEDLINQAAERMLPRTKAGTPARAEVEETVAQLRWAQKRTSEARQSYRDTIESLRHGVPLNRRALAPPLAALGQLTCSQGGTALIREAVEIYRETLPADNWRLKAAESSLAACIGSSR
ncbi:MAG: tetratricopeptide repeat protein [Bryobacteraceae bacterium]